MTKSATAAAQPHAVVELVPLDKIAPDPGNPRRTFTGIEELAEAIAQHGVIQPILVRPMPGIGSNLLMIVCGERRYRAAKAAGLAEIPAIRRELTDGQALELQLVENLNRPDVHPLEEAEGYERLLQSPERKYTVEDIAAKVGKSKGYVYGRMKLLALCPAARKAFYEEKISASHALLLARIPVHELQEKALAEITEGLEYEEGPMSLRDAQTHVLEKYTLRLGDTPFDRKDPDLVPSAGACTTCPKRSGAQPELFTDAKSTDLCLDPTCFADKKNAAWKKKAAAAEADGVKVLTAKETTKVFDPWGYGNAVTKRDSPFVDLNERCPDDPKERTWRQVLGKSAPDKVLARDKKGRVHELVDREAAIAAAKKAGVKIEKPRTYDAAADRAQYERKEKLRRAVQERIAAAVVARVEKAEPDTKLWRIAAEANAENYDVASALERRFGEDPEPETVRAAIEKMTGAQLRGLVLEFALQDVLHSYESGHAKDLIAWARVDVKAIEKEVKEEQKEAEKNPPGTGPIEWSLTPNAQEPPDWVKDATGLETVKALVDKYGPGAKFTRGHPTPPPAAKAPAKKKGKGSARG